MNALKMPDARGWIGIGVFALSVMLLWMMKDPALRGDEFFQTIATVIIANGLMAVISWAYAATKNGGELAEKNAAIVAESATASVAIAAALPTPDRPQPVEVVNTPAAPVPTEAVAAAAEPTDAADLPDYAK
jgi:hypothetical protein